ncbi:dual specificity calcium/calmodulin-dependent 3',5'-cyclic nucleotide phosphodiesterase 1C isoform X2 [Dunckerocampus dactyliophorus]|uniref:dual specificity calcium/calmodulin-dependent 3',5'-cyclic nucleotide phosphodiesterase 1C isoform X2 n=1 Tax=Dunckerocampus dactyliophorus TaxID=161453 RepID=UPI002406A2C7|nr:dual specificity calcium/calmodulin-dependent 3',5'-cyclic nucleotide phosphodiesterase 1C isoform X2 [Dunckerocampus dactyliophorus]
MNVEVQELPLSPEEALQEEEEERETHLEDEVKLEEDMQEDEMQWTEEVEREEQETEESERQEVQEEGEDLQQEEDQTEEGEQQEVQQLEEQKETQQMEQEGEVVQQEEVQQIVEMEKEDPTEEVQEEEEVQQEEEQHMKEVLQKEEEVQQQEEEQEMEEVEKEVHLEEEQEMEEAQRYDEVLLAGEDKVQQEEEVEEREVQQGWEEEEEEVQHIGKFERENPTEEVQLNDQQQGEEEEEEVKQEKAQQIKAVVQEENEDVQQLDAEKEVQQEEEQELEEVLQDEELQQQEKEEVNQMQQEEQANDKEKVQLEEEQQMEAVQFQAQQEEAKAKEMHQGWDEEQEEMQDFVDVLDQNHNSQVLNRLRGMQKYKTTSQRLKAVLDQMDHGVVDLQELRCNLQLAVSMLDAVYTDETKRLLDPEDELSDLQAESVPSEVRDWLACTFSRKMGVAKRRPEEKPRFRSIVHAVQAGIFVERMYRRTSNMAGLTYPPTALTALKDVDQWSFDVFSLHEATGDHALKFLVYELLTRYDLITRFRIPVPALVQFVEALENGYSKHKNPYHNLVHAADVTQTAHFLMLHTGLMHWLSELEILAMVFAAAIHDFEHTGTTNNFHIHTRSEVAIFYNDRSVLENHHVSAAYRLMAEEDTNILVNLNKDDWRELRALVIEMVMSTDMSCHFQQIKTMRNTLTQSHGMDKVKVLSLMLHAADISHPAKAWPLHFRWTHSLMEEFFRQVSLTSSWSRHSVFLWT